MSMQDYEEAKKLIRDLIKIPGMISTFVGPKQLILIEQAESLLSVKFPETYRQFILEFGAGGIGSFEIFGIVQNDINHHDYLYIDVVGFTLKARQEWNLPNYLIPIYDLGDGEMFCLDLKVNVGDEAKVVGFTPGYSNATQSLDVVAEDFGKLFLDLIRLSQNIKGKE